jgi:thioredoxin-like negative regulator of GroEL
MSQTEKHRPIRAFFAELLQRRVLQIGGAYIAGAWLCVEIFTFLFDQFLAPGWAYRLMTIVLVVGFPVSMVLAWIIQIDKEGHWEIDHSRGDTRNLAVAIVIGVLITAGLSWWLLPQREPPAPFEPMAMSLAVLFTEGSEMPPDLQASADRLYLSMLSGLERAPVLTLVQPSPRGHTGEPLATGRTLGVAWLGLLSHEAAADQNRIKVRLLDVVTGETSGEQVFDLDVARVPETAYESVNLLLDHVALLPLDENQFFGTGTLAAYEAYLDGIIHLGQSGQLQDAVKDFQAAIDLDPGFATAYVGLARSLYELAGMLDTGDEGRQSLEEQARQAVYMARRLDPLSADAMSLFALQLDNPQLKYQAWERALELDPDHAMSLYRYGAQKKISGSLEEAEGLLKRAVRLRPDNARFRTELATIYGLQGRQDEARAELNTAATLSR